MKMVETVARPCVLTGGMEAVSDPPPRVAWPDLQLNHPSFLNKAPSHPPPLTGAWTILTQRCTTSCAGGIHDYTT